MPEDVYTPRTRWPGLWGQLLSTACSVSAGAKLEMSEDELTTKLTHLPPRQILTVAWQCLTSVASHARSFWGTGMQRTFAICAIVSWPCLPESQHHPAISLVDTPSRPSRTPGSVECAGQLPRPHGLLVHHANVLVFAAPLPMVSSTSLLKPWLAGVTAGS